MPPPTVLITAGPTHEPIDAVRFIGNRSSGKMGVALADECARRGWATTLLLGPAPARPTEPRVALHSFRTCEDLRVLLADHAARADILIMAAAVADYRPKVDPTFFGGKFRRKNQNLTLELEPTPDLLAGVAASRRPDQLFIGFALEPREEMIAAATEKMRRKHIDLVVANPLETMDSPTIEAVVLTRDGERLSPGSAMPKARFAPWLLDVVARAWQGRQAVAR
jgi:phosphopantothenoylcysteine decarboxylase/phosphopantothenate--cysteine ligase